MKVKTGLFVLPLLFTGCLNLNLKQILPSVKDYDLNVGAIETQTCKNTLSVGLLEVLSADLYNTKSIVKRTLGGEITYLKEQKFADAPTNMFKRMLFLQAPRHCISISPAPYANASSTLQLNVLTLALLDNTAEVVLDYTLTTGAESQHKRIVQKQPIPKEQDLSQIQALQRVSLKAIDQLLAQIEQTAPKKEQQSKKDEGLKGPKLNKSTF
ncbi:ABC-type transport auxiliary lipoprotein family protein [Helicobacter ailurogastricus]|uniref:ABC-type transport auxiliary lipoprotein family protein n=1 Tax=Helicobacter ailurogastricus TaxID=1578720 RepID=UPI00244D87E4|nr:ABC-type transport auxiliary lipoprotein family protein [Helicobacter ailurogastricus]GMB91807.1 ABC_trans_aux domain-containing protein [Helicobacter ailurogastricus]